ncbi:LD-carboxypeptidase [Thermodesulfobacteriota bacterium]
MPNILKPNALQAGDTVGIVAPAGPYDAELLEQGIAVLENMGFKVHVPEGLDRSERFLAGSDRHRADIFNSCFENDAIQGIFCARGGYGSLRILDLIDYRMIEDNPKVFVGLSDITAIHMALITRCRLVTFHGPVVTRLGEDDQKTLDVLSAAISSGRKLEIKPKSGTIVQSGRCEGIVAGGNLTTLCHLLGTPYAPEFRNHILLLEDIAEAPYKIDRKLFQMKRSGCLDGVRGVVLGDFTDCGSHKELIASAKDIFSDVEIPIMAGFNFGHELPNLTIPIGLPGVLDTEKGSLKFEEPATQG